MDFGLYFYGDNGPSFSLASWLPFSVKRQHPCSNLIYVRAYPYGLYVIEIWKRSRYVSQNPDRVWVVRPGSQVIQFLKFAEAAVVLADDFLDTPNQAVSAILAIPATLAISSRMVFCGKPSKGCASCRAKKTKVRCNVQLSFLGFRGHPGIPVNSL